MYVTFFTFPTVNKKDLFWSLTVMCKWSKCDVFFTLLLQTPSWAGQESGFWWITRALWCCIFFPPHLSLKEQITVLHLVQVITNSIKVTNKTIFTHDCLISGHYILHLRFEWSELCFFSLSLSLFFFFFCSGNTWWSFNVRIESPSGTVKTSACVMMNGCLVCWFYGVFSGSLHCGRQPPWVGCQLKERGGGGNGGDVQLPVVILCASHPVHLRTWGSHKEPLARRTQSF